VRQILGQRVDDNLRLRHAVEVVLDPSYFVMREISAT